MRSLSLSLVFALLASPLAAQDRAILLGADRYASLGRLARGGEILNASDELETLGYSVQALRNPEAAAMIEALDAFAASAPDAERLIIALAGRFATDGTHSWYLAADADPSSPFGLGAEAVLLGSIMEILAERPGQALLLLGVDPGESGAFGPWLRGGISRLDIPQGVSVLQGAPRDIARFLESEVARPGADFMAPLRRNRNVSGAGFLPAHLSMAPETAPEMPQPDAIQRQAEEELWAAAQAVNTLDAYDDYLQRYPRGRFSVQAEARIDALLAASEQDEQLTEEGLELTRDERRTIQRNLSLLGYNTRGIDGIFGAGTRQAISTWQQQNGFSQTSFLTAEQISRLAAQAARRAAELETEAEAERQRVERLDRAYWDQTGARGDEPGYRAYLTRYPEGLYAERARARLAEIEQDKRQIAQAQDRAAWDRARQTDSLSAYRRYLEDFPQGTFQEEAQARIAALTQGAQSDAERAKAEAEERALGLNPITARLVEARLEAAGLNPGPVDGRFDEATRRALRRYQRDRNLPATGYLNEATVVRLLADAVGIFE